MAQTLAKVLKAGEQEWRAFIEGSAISTSLLIQLLSYKYRRQKAVSVRPQAIIVEEGHRLPIPEPLVTRSLIEYELSVVLFRREERSIQALLIRRRVFPYLLFATKELAQEDTEQLEYEFLEEETVTTSLSNNGYFILAFIDVYFKAQRGTEFTMDTEEEASLIVQELEKPTLVRQTLATLYRELNTLLADRRVVAATTTNETRRRVETKKQHFFQVIKDALTLTSRAMPTLTAEATCFLQLPVLSKDDDEEEEAHSDSLFKELQQLLQFVLLVVKTAPRGKPRPISLYIEINGTEYGPTKVIRRVWRLTNRILAHVDELNVPPIDTLMQAKLGFGQHDYERLIGDEQFITFAIISNTLPTTPYPKVMLLGPREEQQGTRVIPLKSQPLILWVTEHHTSETLLPLPYYSLAIVARRGQEEPAIYQEAIYAGSAKTREAVDVRRRTQNMLLNQAGIKSSRRQIITTTTEMSAYHFSTWHIALLIKQLSEATRVVSSPTSFDWVKRADEFLKETTQAQLVANRKRIVLTAQRNILALLYECK